MSHQGKLPKDLDNAGGGSVIFQYDFEKTGSHPFVCFPRLDTSVLTALRVPGFKSWFPYSLALTTAKLFSFSRPQFCHLQSRNNSSFSHIGLLCGANELILMRREQNSAWHSKCSVRLSYYYVCGYQAELQEIREKGYIFQAMALKGGELRPSGHHRVGRSGQREFTQEVQGTDSSSQDLEWLFAVQSRVLMVAKMGAYVREIEVKQMEKKSQGPGVTHSWGLLNQ